jgi:hypothetical protein
VLRDELARYGGLEIINVVGVRAGLAALRIPDRQIHSERFDRECAQTRRAV